MVAVSKVRHWTWTGISFRRGTVYWATGTYLEAIARVIQNNAIHKNDLDDPTQFVVESLEAIARESKS